MDFFSIENVVFHVLDYPISYVELLGTLFGLISVALASRENVLTWPTGIVNEAFLFLLFYQVQLYADMLLQVYFFVVTLYGWYFWRVRSEKGRVTQSSLRGLLWQVAGVVLGTLVAGFVVARLHQYLPGYFSIPAAYPYVDAFVMTGSILATVLLAKKKIETWYWWMAVDAVCVLLYFSKAVLFLSIEYLIFLGLAVYGWKYWERQRVEV